MRLFIKNTFFKFLIVGVINTMVGSGVMFGLYHICGCSYWVSSGANYLAGSIVSYFLNKHFTFQNRQKGWRPLIKFICNILICYALAYGLAKPMIAFLLKGKDITIQENTAMLAGMCFFVIFNYIGQRFFTFKVTANQ